MRHQDWKAVLLDCSSRFLNSFSPVWFNTRYFICIEQINTCAGIFFAQINRSSYKHVSISFEVVHSPVRIFNMLSQFLSLKSFQKRTQNCILQYYGSGICKEVPHAPYEIGEIPQQCYLSLESRLLGFNEGGVYSCVFTFRCGHTAWLTTNIGKPIICSTILSWYFGRDNINSNKNFQSIKIIFWIYICKCIYI